MCPWIAWSPTHVAEATGIWKDLGVSVQVINQIGEEEHLLAVTHRQVDLSIDMIGNLVGMHQDGVDVTILAELDWSHGGDKIMGRTDKPLAAGTVIGVYHKAPAVLMFADAFLRSKQLQLSDVTITQHEPADLSGLFIGQRLDVVLTYDPYSAEITNASGVILGTTADFPGCMPEGLGGRSDVIAAIPKEDLQKICLGLIKAREWMDDPANWAAYLRILNERTFQEPVPEAEIKEMLTNVRIHRRAELIERNRPGSGLHAFLGQLRQMMEKNQLLERDFTSEALIDTSAIMAALNQP
jgi:ABC-type nitrate/sulfonate/bicarbonate transport system substrate-binding protein